MKHNTDDTSGRTADEPTKKGRGGFQGSPESLKNLRRGDQPPERHVEAQDQAAEITAVTEDVSLYDDMKHVRTLPKALDRTEGQRTVRKWLEKDLKG
jgi:hypothetical protein